MKKLLQTFFVIMLMLLTGGGIISAGEVTVTFTAGTDKGSQSSASTADKVSKDNVTIESTKGAFAAAQYRFGASSSNTFKAAGKITKIVLTCTASGTATYGPGNMSTSDGQYTAEDKIGTWTGNADSVVFKASAQVRATEIAVTYITDDTSQKTKTTLTFTESANKTFAINETEDITFTNIATLSPNVEGASITYTSSDTEVATVTDKGEVTVTTAKAGTTTITASYAGDNSYAASEASYLVTVKSAESTGEWTKTSLSDLTSTDKVVIVDLSSSRAMSNDNGTSKAPQAISITLSSDKSSLTGTINDNLVWTVANNGDNTYTFYPNGDTAKWLYTTNENNGVRVGTNDNNKFKEHTSGNYNGLINSSTNRYVGVYNNQDWRCYTSVNNNIAQTSIAYYKLTTSGDSKTATKITFAQGNATFQQNQNTSDKYEYTNAAEVTTKDGADVENATVTYTSSDKDHADVDANGKVTIDPTVAGTYTITATYDGDDNYANSTASYTITIIEGEGTLEKPYTVADAIAIVKANKQTTDNVYVKGIVTNVISTEANIAQYNDCDYYIADSEDATDQMEAYHGKYLGNTTVTSADQILKGDKVILCGVLTTYKTTIELGEGNYIASFWDSKELTIDENNTNTIENARHATVTLARTFNSNAWNTLVLPFNMTAEQVTATFGSDTQLAKYIGTTLNNDGTYTLNFETTTTITANTPVFVYGAKDVDNEAIEDVNMVAATPIATPSDAAFAFTGSYEGLTPKAGDWFISSDNNFYRAKGTETMKATRAIFRPTTAEASAKGITMVMDDKPTAISGVTADNAFNEDTPAYNLAGQRVTNNYHGLIIKRGKKYVSK